MTFLLKILSPKKIPAKRSEWNWHVRCHEWMLRRLFYAYRRGAVSDTIQLGNVQIIHNVRDYWYEQELQRFHIDTAQHLEKRSVPLYLNRKLHRSVFFHWTVSLLVFYEGKSYNIKRGKTISIETEIDGKLKISSEKDIILRSEFEAKDVGRQSHSLEFLDDNSSTLLHEPENRGLKQKIFVKDTAQQQGVANKKQFYSTKYQGFEENNAF